MRNRTIGRRMSTAVADAGAGSPASRGAARGAGQPHHPRVTYSIVALDPATGDLGVAVQSKFLAVGAVVPWARAGIGAVATQAFANVTYGPEGLALLGRGVSAAEALEQLVGADPLREQR